MYVVLEACNISTFSSEIPCTGITTSLKAFGISLSEAKKVCPGLIILLLNRREPPPTFFHLIFIDSFPFRNYGTFKRE